MEVICERCSTGYEFDDALVSERGTTVKCTHCGHQFKVRRTDGALPETWLVRTVDGRELEFKALRDLQAAISIAEISREDVLSRGNSRPRRLGSIAELEPFFKGFGPGTAPGLGPPRPGGAPEPPPPPFRRTPSAPPPPMSDAGSAEPMTPPVGRMPIVPPTPPPPAAEPTRRTLPPGVVVAGDDAPPLPVGYAARAPEAAAEPAAGAEEGAGVEADADKEPEPAATAPTVEEPAPPAAARAPAEAAPSVIPAPPRVPVAVSMLPYTPTPSDVRLSITDDAYGEPRFTSIAPSRRSGAARWMVGLIVVGLAVLAGVTIIPRYLKPAAPAPERAGDERVAALVAEAERSLLDGDVEGARDKLLKASALAETDPKVAADLARLEAASADLRWIRVRLMEEQDPDQAMARQDLEVAVARARKALEHAEKVAPEDAAVRRARVDLLRLQGDIGRAREMVGAMAGGGAQPEGALTLAALDLAEAQPSWPVAIERLRAAAGSEQSLGRARAMLIYALARSGDVPAARAEYERLAVASRPHPLAPALRAFIERLERAAPGGRADAKDARNAKSSKDGKDGKDAKAPRPAPAGGSRPRPAPADDGRVPDDYVAPDQSAPVDTSDLNGAGHAPAPAPAPSPEPAPAPSPSAPPPSTPPPEIDTSDLPGIKHE